MKHMNLKIPNHSYFFGFVQTDGTLRESTRNRGKLEIEIGEKDLHILKSFKNLFPSIYCSIRTRNRDTNFKKGYKSYVFGLYNLEFRKEINNLGIPYGKKSEIVLPPKVNFCERDYIRGLIDGDGSLGLTNRNIPFVSFTVKSEGLKDYLLSVIEKNTGERKRISRNTRDNIYNIMLNGEKAQDFIKYLYYSDCLCLKRKLRKTKLVLKWKRPKDLKRVFRKLWDEQQDNYILTHTIQESCNFLKRTDKSIKMRLWRIKNNKVKA